MGGSGGRVEVSGGEEVIGGVMEREQLLHQSAIGMHIAHIHNHIHAVAATLPQELEGTLHTQRYKQSPYERSGQCITYRFMCRCADAWVY